MRPVVTTPWLSVVSLALGLSACSLVVDFPARPTADEDGSIDAGRDDGGPERNDGGGRDGSRADAAGDTGTRDAMPSMCSPATLTSCGDSKLCCDRKDGNGPGCVAVSSASDCTECGVGCMDPSAPHCGNRVCECAPGSGVGCAAGQVCLGEGAAASCVQCTADADCAARTDKRNQCVANECVECDRGPLPNDPADDQGCSGNTPICGPTGTCVGCSDTVLCPAGQQCNVGQGCFGCKVEGPLASSGCSGTTPICRPVDVMGQQQFQCQPCVNNTDCKGDYCDNATGACINACDPQEAPGANGCANKEAPICKPSGASYACSACTAASDCRAPAANCAVDGPLAGQCVACRNNTDCSQTGLTPVCGATGTCRARVASDCTGATPRFDPVSMTCVECLTASETTDCMGNLKGAFCNAAMQCSQCRIDDHCPAPGPRVCNLATNTCTAGCNTSAQCAPPAPLCLGGACVGCATQADCTTAAAPVCAPATNTCVACNALGVPAAEADRQCAMKPPMMSPVCVRTTGSCGVCDPTTNLGCMPAPSPAPYCLVPPATGVAACYACNPVAVPTGCAPGTLCSPTTFTCVAVELPDAGLPPPL